MDRFMIKNDKVFCTFLHPPIGIPIFMPTLSLLCFLYPHPLCLSVIVYWGFCFLFPSSILLLVSVHRMCLYYCILNVTYVSFTYVFISYLMPCFEIVVVLLSVHRPCCCNLVPYLLFRVLCLISTPPWLSLDLKGQSTSDQERRQSSRNSGFSLLLLSDIFLFQLMVGQGFILCDNSTASGSHRWCCVKCFANRFIVPVVLWFVTWSVW
jgi:hypothetical protein